MAKKKITKTKPKTKTKTATKTAKKKVVKKTVAKKASKKPAAKAVKRVTTVNVYLNFDGNCEQAFDFYRSVFGGKFMNVSRYKEMPSQDGNSEPSDNGDKIMHISLPISEQTAIMGCDISEGYGPPFRTGNNFSITVNAVSKAAADKIFTGLLEGGNATMPLADVFWGDYFGMLTDKFGIQWMISFSPKG